MDAGIGRRAAGLAGLLVVCGAVSWAALGRPDTPRTLAADLPGATGPEKYTPTPDDLRDGYRRADRAGPPRGRVSKAQVTAHWFHGNTRFWYRNDLAGGTREFVLVDAERGTREPAFDHQKLAA